jgi:hypothetical protein
MPVEEKSISLEDISIDDNNDSYQKIVRFYAFEYHVLRI